MAVERITYQAGNLACNGALVYDENVSGPRPLLLVAPNWLGVTEESINRAAVIAGSRYVAFVADMYGNGKIAAGPPEAGPLADALRQDAPERRRRIGAALGTLRSESGKRKIGDLKRQAAVGFCFRGGNVLELARAGAGIQAVICLHGDLLTPLPAQPGDIKAAICVMHGSKDPIVPKQDRDSFETEMENSGAKWQMTVFGGLLHSFCEAESDVPGIACYDPGAARQCIAAIDDFSNAAFDGKL
ncbi:MAG: dienelactone hydrolase family protein [Pseudolabrys sp.]|nr:dienelactone hydrolase family protein [Pseudolabrys sp.]